MTETLHPLRIWRLRQDMSLNALGAKVGVTGVTISRVEKSVTKPSAALSRRLSKVTGLGLWNFRPDIWSPPKSPKSPPPEPPQRSASRWVPRRLRSP